ncbi:MAG: carotenoid biosynthesis protein [bacterium]
MMQMRGQHIMIALLYVFLLAGGLWHVLGVLQKEMRLLAAPMIVMLCLLLCFEYLRQLRVDATSSNHASQRFVLWSVFVLIGGFCIELAGVKTGIIFGLYFYGETLQPTLWKIPLAIGFAWLGMIISAAVISQRLLPARFSRRPLLMAACIAILMVIFDVFMEPAAMKLGYWIWHEGVVPWRNYLAWFVFGFIFSYIGLRLGLLMEKSSPLAMHANVAQLGYFMLVKLA